MDTFAPTKWTSLKVPKVDFETTPGMPASLLVKSRPIRQELYAHAKKKFDRLVQYFYEQTSGSPIASPLVIASKATSPFIRFCGDYRVINEYTQKNDFSCHSTFFFFFFHQTVCVLGDCFLTKNNLNSLINLHIPVPTSQQRQQTNNNNRRTLAC